MISFGMAAAAAARLPITEIWWNVPAAIAYQLAFVWWETQGNNFRIDKREEIRAALCRKT